MRLIIGVLLFWGSVASAEDLSLDQAFATINAVRNAGGNHKSTIEAWQVISRTDANSLTRILAAIDDEKPLAANWLRAAAEHVAERAIQNGRQLPTQALEQLVFNASVSPRARRLGYEWLARVDETAKERIIPQMLNDSSVEMRRDAVAEVLLKASLLGSKADAIAEYRTALAAARDTDQIDQAYEKLVELGEQVDLPRHFGFVTKWKLIGPFDNTDKQGFDVAYPPENELAFDKKYRGKASTVGWIEHDSQDKYGMVNLNEALGKNMGAAAYAYTMFESPTDREVDLRLGCINATKLWLNGDLLLDREVYHAGTKIDQYVARGDLKVGANSILLKVCQNEQTENWAQDWQFQLRVCDRVGTAILSANTRPIE